MRLIDADRFREDLKTERENLYFNGLLGTPRDTEEIDQFIDRLDEQPTIEAELVLHGEWVYGKFCSECGFQTKPNEISPYCPNCGVKMDLEE